MAPQMDQEQLDKLLASEYQRGIADGTQQTASIQKQSFQAGYNLARQEADAGQLQDGVDRIDQVRQRAYARGYQDGMVEADDQE